MKRFAFLVAGLVLALGWAGWLGAIRDPAVVRYRVELAGLQRPLRMVHLSDLHGSNWDMPQVRLNRIMDQLNALHPDLVVVTGDFHASKIWDPPMRMDDAVQPLTRLKAPLGVWSVPGNHDDPYWIRWVMRRFGLKLLAGDLVDLGPIQIVGSDDLIMGQRPVQGLRAAAARAQPGKPLVALVHEPRLWTMLPANVDLVLAGHTHGGQIQIFGWPQFKKLDSQYLRGRFRNPGGQQMLVSAGIGTSIVPVRLGTQGEIVVVELVPQPPGRNSGTDK
ncbi:metallophosphoesterase [Sandarakinorhabdus limnophila]|uniref:metallophosphoesterase n=1 Tax=Sandarakinorhabdus limnophila TaxID=210512 RepID=UPI002355977F|nr:metallophosphoesterase [Sandarakinorhabdus limnophila]